MLATTCCLTGAALAVSGNARSLIKLAPTGVWFANNSGGSVSHVGTSGTDATVALNNPMGDLRMTTIDGVAFVIDAQGRASRIDPALLTVSNETILPSAMAQIVGRGGHSYAVDPVSGTVREIDPVQFTAIGQALVVGKKLGPAVVDTDGVLWIADAATGTVVQIQGSTIRATRQISQPGTEVRLAIIGSGVVAINPSSSTVTVLSGGSGRVGSTNTVTVEPGGTFATPDLIDEGTVLPLLSKTVLTTVDLGNGQSQRTDLVLPGHRLGTPQVAGGKVYVPDFTAGTLVVVDIATGAIVNTITVTGTAGTFEVAVEAGRVFVNDPNSERAWSLDVAGNLTPIVKYDPNRSGDSGSAPPTIPPAPKIPPTPPPTTAPPSQRPSPDYKPRPTEQTNPPKPPNPPGTRRDPGPAATIPPVVEIPDPASPPAHTNDNIGVSGHGVPPDATTTTSTTATTTTTTVPGAPAPLGDGAVTAVVASAGDATATVTWLAPTNWQRVTAYEVVVDPGSSTHQATATAGTYTVTGLANGSPYTLTVTALSGATRGVSVRSNPVTPASVVPGAPQNVVATPGDTQIVVTWDAPAGLAVAGYAVDVVPEAGGAPITTTLGPRASSTTVTGLTNGAGYHAVIRAANAGGAYGPPSASTTVTPRGRPGPPVAVTASVTAANQITVAWTASNDNGSPITGYTIVAPGLPNGYTVPTVTDADYARLTVGTTYTFTVTATNAFGTSDPVTPPPVLMQVKVPDAPGGVTATATDGAANLSWTAPNSNGTAIAGYIVRNLTDGTTRTTNATTYTYTGLTNGTAYAFDVQALGANSSTSPPGPASPASVVPAGPPSPPVIVGVVATSPTTIDVSYSQQSPSNGTTVGQFAISTNPATTTLTIASGSATLTGLTPGTAYTVTVIALGTNGLDSAPASGSATTSTGLPAGLSGLVRSSLSMSSIRLAWNASAGADGYRIDTGGGPTLAPIAGTSISWTHGGTPGTGFTVTVTPYNSYGDGPSAQLSFVVPDPLDPCIVNHTICP